MKKIEDTEKETKKQCEVVLGKLFSPGQIKKLMNPEKTIRWSPTDIASAISLRSVSPKAYRYLRSLQYPLPALSTLRKWASTIEIIPGILKSVISLMKKKSFDFSTDERLCVLSFDKVYLSNRIYIDKKQEQIVGPHNTCQTVIARGLISNWKQPVYFKFDQPMKKEILEDIISQLYIARFIVVAIVCDMGSSNVSLWTKLNVGYDGNIFFSHPSDNLLKIFVLADVPHLLKLARNHLLDNGFVLENTIINKDCFEKLLSVSTTELTFAHKLTPHHFNLKGSMRQRVRPAVQLFSNSVAEAIQYCGEMGHMPKNSPWSLVSKIAKLFNDWFDLLNSHLKYVGNCPGKNAFGTNLDTQKNLLNKMSAFIANMRVGNHKGLIPFQKGILLTNRPIPELYDYVHDNYKVDYLLTSRLNQDVVENFFAYIRGMGGPNDLPTPLDF